MNTRKQHPIQHHFEGHDGFPLSVWEYPGEGPVCLFVHCTGGCARLWDPVLVALEGKLHAYAIDTRGHGDSGKPLNQSAYAWRHSGRDLLSWLQHINCKGSVLGIGHSGGATQLAYAALEAPDAFHALLLCDPIIAPEIFFNTPNPLAKKARRRIDSFPNLGQVRKRLGTKLPFALWSEEAREAYFQYGFEKTAEGAIALKCPRKVEAWIYEQEGIGEVFAALSTLEAPTLLVTAEQSEIAPLVHEQQKHFSHSTLLKLADLGHFIPQQDPLAFAQLIQQWSKNTYPAL